MLNSHILGILDIDAVMLMIKAGQCLLPGSFRLVLAQCSIIAHSVVSIKVPETLSEREVVEIVEIINILVAGE